MSDGAALDGLEGRGPTPTVVLVAHVTPAIHGQAVMASALVAQAARWQEVRLAVVNAVYTTSRESLVAFSFRKVALTLRYIGSTIATIHRTRARLVVVTPAFYAGPFLKDAVVICAVKALTRARVIAWVHMDPARLDLERKPWWYRQVARYALGRVDAWVACAPALTRQWPSFIPPDRRQAVTNGIPGAPECIQADARVSEATRVCFVSSLESSKGWTDLLGAADEVCASDADVEFHFYGNVGAHWTEDAVARRFRACRFRERIVWHGVTRGLDKWRSLQSADLFCLPSRSEQFPIVILEAMASGLAVVATRVGAVEEAVVEGQGGWLVAPGSREELRHALAQALEDRDRLQRFGRFNAERRRREFSIERFGNEWEQLLKSLAS